MTGRARTRTRTGTAVLLALAGAIVAMYALSAAIGADYPAEWANMDATGLAALAGQLKTQGASATDQRKLLAEYVTGRFLTDQATIQAVNYESWENLAKSLSADVTSGMKEDWRTKLRSAFGARDMTCIEATHIQGTLWELGEQHGNEFIATWTAAHSSWQSWSLDQLVELGGLLGWGYHVEQAVTDGRWRVAQHLSATYIADAAAVRSVGGQRWKAFARCYNEGLSDSDRAVWAGKIRQAFAGGGAVQGLPLQEAGPVAEALLVLGARNDAAGIASAWVKAHGDVELQPTDLEAALSVGRALAPLKNVPASAAALAGWRDKLRTACGAKVMSCEELCAAQSVLKLLDDTAINLFVADWTKHHSQWTSWPATDVVTLGIALGWGYEECAQDVADARRRVATHVQATYLSSAKAASQLSCSQWCQLARCVGASADPESREIWISVLKEALAGNKESLVALSPGDIACLSIAIAVLGDKDQAAEMALTWLSDHGTEGLQKSDTGTLAWLTSVLAPASSDPRAGRFMSDIEAALAARDSGGPLAFKDYENTMKAWQAAGNKAKAQEWAMKAYQAFFGSQEARETLDYSTLEYVCLLMYNAGVTGQGKGYAGFAEALARLAHEGEFADKGEWAYLLRSPLQTDQTRQTVEAALTDASGNPRLTVAKILAWSYSDAKKLDEWKAGLDGRIRDAAEGSDTKARWLLARAYAESIIEAYSRHWSPMRGEQMLEQALATAASEECRLAVLSEMLDGYAAIGRHDRGRDRIDSFASQYGSDGDVGLLLGKMRFDLDQKEAVYKEARAALAEKVDKERRDARHAELTARLERARSKGDGEGIARYERLLGLSN